MSAILNIPFNFQPVGSPTRKTASYTIPAGRYAKAVLSFYQPRYFSFSAGSSGATQNNTMANITINGVNVLSERQFGISLNPLYAGNSTYYITIRISGFAGLFQGYCLNAFQIATNNNTGGGGLFYDGGNSTAITSQANFPFIETITSRVPLSAGQLQFISGTIISHSTPEFIEVWLKSGDVISSTGGNWQAIVTEYASIS